MALDMGGSIKFKGNKELIEKLNSIFFNKEYNDEFDLAFRYEIYESKTPFEFIQEIIEKVSKKHDMYYYNPTTLVWRIEYNEEEEEIELLYQGKYKLNHCTIDNWVNPTIDDIKYYMKDVYGEIIHKLNILSIDTDNLKITLWLDKDGNNSWHSDKIDLDYILSEIPY